MSHTKGEWTAGPDEDGNPNELEVQSSNGQLVANIFGRTKEEREANAQLIATAPAMLATLRFVRRAMIAGPEGEPRPFMEEAHGLVNQVIISATTPCYVDPDEADEDTADGPFDAIYD